MRMSISLKLLLARSTEIEVPVGIVDGLRATQISLAQDSLLGKENLLRCSTNG